MTTILNFDPLKGLPPGKVLTRPQYEALWDEAIRLERALTSQEIEDIVGPAEEIPSLKRDFETGMYPTYVRKNQIE